MRKLFVGSLVAGGLLFAADQPQNRMSSLTREALETQSPRVHLKMHKHKTLPPDRVVSDKTTINTYIPYGK